MAIRDTVPELASRDRTIAELRERVAEVTRNLRRERQFVDALAGEVERLQTAKELTLTLLGYVQRGDGNSASAILVARRITELLS